MPETTNSKVDEKAKVWLHPEQVEELRNAVYECRPSYLQQRDDALIQLMYNTGLRVGELVQVNVEMLRDGNSKMYLPASVQKDYPNENSPDPVTLSLSSDTTRTLSAYLNSRWKDTDALFPSRSADRMSTQAVRNMLHKVSETAGIRPYRIDGTRGEPEEVTPHTLRHSVAYRMMNHEEGNRLYDVRNRLRHRSIQTTERVYDHMREV